jgi:hypothetical protein
MKTQNGWHTAARIAGMALWILGRACALAFVTTLAVCLPYMGKWTDPRP